MAVRFYKALWGMPESTLQEKLSKIHVAGYDGFEAPLHEVREHRQVLDEGVLGYIAMLFVDDAESLRKGVDEALVLGAEKITVHAGRDFWSFDEGCRFFEDCLEAIRDTPVGVNFETHRGRLLFTPAITEAYLRRFPQMRIAADFSHFTCVCESMLGDQASALAVAIEHTSHVHARVGHEEGPQVNDPRADEWQGHVARFEQWWDAMLAAHQARGETMTVDPEFGPPNYMPTMPYSQEPLADLWDVCLYMKDRLHRRWA